MSDPPMADRSASDLTAFNSFPAEIETHYVPVGDNRYRQALIWAKETAARKGYIPGRIPSAVLDDHIRTWLACHPETRRSEHHP